MTAVATLNQWPAEDDADMLARVVELQLTVIEIREMVSTLEAIATDVLASLAPSDEPLSMFESGSDIF
jgi:tetrahydromethanopterin S-methyltransferase subunit B